MRRTMRRFLLACGAALVCAGLVAGGAAAQRREKLPSPEKVIERHVKAAGGKKALQAVRGVRLVGEVQGSAGGGQGPAFVWQRMAPHFAYLQVGEAIEAFNGRSAWREDAAGLRTLTGREQMRARATALFRNDRFLDYKKDKTRVQLAGREPIAGRDAYAVLLTTRAGLQRKLWFDAQSYLLLQEEQERDDGTEQILYGDYRAVDGVLEPFRVTLRRGEQSIEAAIRTVTHNPSLDPAVFAFPQRSSGPLPDVAGLLHAVEQNQKQVDELQDKYTYNVSETNLEVDGKGNLKTKSERQYEVFYLGGRSYWKLTGKDGRPLSESDARKEQERVEKFIREYEEEKKKEAAAVARGKVKKKDEDDDVTVLAFLQLARFVNPRRERFRGQPVIVFDFEPRPGYKPRNRGESLVHKLGGTLWIDERARQVARLEARMLDSFRIGGGLVASFGRGSAVVFEQELLHNEIWLPSYAEMNVSARLLLVAGVKVNRILRFSNYQRFRVDATSEIQPPTQPPR